MTAAEIESRVPSRLNIYLLEVRLPPNKDRPKLERKFVPGIGIKFDFFK